jgi:hypothetical protein
VFLRSRPGDGPDDRLRCGGVSQPKPPSRFLQLVRTAQSAKRDNLAAAPAAPFPARRSCSGAQNDLITPRKSARDFHRLLPNSELRHPSPVRHAPMLEQPVRYTSCGGFVCRWTVLSVPICIRCNEVELFALLT